MTTKLDPSALLREARRRSGLSQRALASRAGTAQSVVARIELGQTDPTAGTLARLLAAAGFELNPRLTPSPIADTHMLEDVERILRLTPEERLQEVANLNRFVAETRRV